MKKCRIGGPYLLGNIGFFPGDEVASLQWELLSLSSKHFLWSNVWGSKYFQEWKGRETYLEGLRRTEEGARRAERGSQVGEKLLLCAAFFCGQMR